MYNLVQIRLLFMKNESTQLISVLNQKLPTYLIISKPTMYYLKVEDKIEETRYISR
jgi:hypothetical protein